MILQKKMLCTLFSAASLISFSSIYSAEEPKADIPTSPAPTDIQSHILHNPLISGEAPASLINAVGKNKFVMFNFNRPAGEAQTLVFSSFPAPIVSEEFSLLFGAKKYAHRTFIPDRIGGKLLKTLFDPKNTYNYQGTPVIDEINKGYSLRLNFSDALQLHQFVSYLRSHQATLKVPAVKPLLYFQAPAKTNMSGDELSFLNSYFTIDDSQDTRKFFVESQQQMDDISAGDEWSEEYKTSWEAIYNHALSDCKKFKTEKIIPAFVRDVVPTLAKHVAAYIIIDSFLNYLDGTNKKLSQEERKGIVQRVKDFAKVENIAKSTKEWVQPKLQTSKK